MKILEGKNVAEDIKKDFSKRINEINVKPNIAVLGFKVDDASNVYIKRIQKNCEKYEIGFKLLLAKTEEEFIENFEQIKNDKSITGIMFQQPLPEKLSNLINEVSPERDIEGISINNMGKLFIGRKDALIPCTSRAVMEALDYYNINLAGKKVVVVGRSNIVGKPLIPQLLQKNATVTICHSKTENLREHTSTADIIIMAIGKPRFLKKNDIKEGAILIDVGINFENGKIVGDVDFEDIKNKAQACTPVPGGIGTITNAVLIDNIIKSVTT
jgi:methylenetetrahydrofolate dehydrogenase (NADP+)/methenyltetrahydrofolate cyclohydrolase